MATNPAQRLINDQDFAVRLSYMMAEAGQLGLFRTMQALHEAVRQVGWELAEQPTRDRADKV